MSNVGIPRLFSPDIACLLNAAVKKLLDADAKIISIKFWGIVYGQQNDYYVLEADADPPDDEEEENPEEEPVLYFEHKFLINPSLPLMLTSDLHEVG